MARQFKIKPINRFDHFAFRRHLHDCRIK